MIRRLLRDSGRRWVHAENLRGRPHPFGWDLIPLRPRTAEQTRQELEALAAMLGTISGKGYQR